MSNICPNCKEENLDSAEFCQYCGSKLVNTVQNQSFKSSKSGFMDWWEKLDTGKKAGSIISVCCLGLLIIGGIAGIISPDNTTVPNQVQDNSTTTNPTPTTTTTTATPSSAISESDFLSDDQGWMSDGVTIAQSATTTDDNVGSGEEDSITAASDISDDQSQIDGIVSDMESITPPSKYQDVYNLQLSSFQEESKALGEEVNALNDNDQDELSQAIDTMKDATNKMSQANNDLDNLS